MARPSHLELADSDHDEDDHAEASLLQACAATTSWLPEVLRRARALEPGQRFPRHDLLALLSGGATPAVRGLPTPAGAVMWLKAGNAPGLRAIPCTSPRYPWLLRELADAPPILWLTGLPQVLGEPAVAIVGARDCSLAATKMARELARDLAASGLVIVSGLARGVDGAAHLGALEAGKTLAVLGSGADNVYPPEHRELAARVRECGALISELPPGAPPRAWHFPRRNRIIAGLSLAVVIVEAAEKSGALITAREALDQGKDVMVVPGSVPAGRNRGGHGLLKDGAALVEEACDVLEILRRSPLASMAGRRSLALQGRRMPSAADAAGLPAQWSIGDEIDLDDLKELMAGVAEDVPRQLLEWELAGHIARTPLGRFVRLCR